MRAQLRDVDAAEWKNPASKMPTPAPPSKPRCGTAQSEAWHHLLGCRSAVSWHCVCVLNPKEMGLPPLRGLAYTMPCSHGGGRLCSTLLCRLCVGRSRTCMHELRTRRVGSLSASQPGESGGMAGSGMPASPGAAAAAAVRQAAMMPKPRAAVYGEGTYYPC